MLSARRDTWLLLVGLCALGWLLMQALHEAGHVLHAVLSDGQVVGVDLHPLRFSRTTLGRRVRAETSRSSSRSHRRP